MKDGGLDMALQGGKSVSICVSEESPLLLSNISQYLLLPDRRAPPWASTTSCMMCKLKNRWQSCSSLSCSIADMPPSMHFTVDSLSCRKVHHYTFGGDFQPSSILPPSSPSSSFPLFARGWVYQERLLSPRVLYFWPGEISWECRTSRACERGMAGHGQQSFINSQALSCLPNQRPDRSLCCLARCRSTVLTDFGLSQHFETGHYSEEGPTAKTLKYADPEALSKTVRNDRSDIFSLGCVYLEMATVIIGSPQRYAETQLWGESNTYDSKYSEALDGLEDYLNKLGRIIHEEVEHKADPPRSRPWPACWL